MRLASFPVYRNNDDPASETVAEIIDATEDGETLVYTDGVQEAVGFVDITDPADPQPAGTVPVEGEPTAVSVSGQYALVGVDTSSSYTDPNGHLAVLDLATRTVVATVDLAGQPDSVQTSPDGRYAAVAIENERDEEVVVDEVEGGLPQAPAGLLQIVDLGSGAPETWSVRDLELTGLAGYAPEDPEPEFVDVNDDNQAVVTLQENNHLVVVDLAEGQVTADFPAGTVDLDGIDTVEDGVVDPNGSLTDVPREPDAVTWLPGDRIATANEGDLFGGSRGFSIFEPAGDLVYDSGTSFEHLAIRHGHYPEHRSENKGTEPEGIEHGRYGREELLFVGSERGNFVAVYDLEHQGPEPELVQFLPTALGPEGLLALPDRDLFVVSSEEDDPPNGVRTTISIFERQRGAAPYPEVISADGPDGRPIPWSALSGLAADPRNPHTLHAVWDSYYAESAILTLDVRHTPAVVRSTTPITGGTGDYDPEGIAFAPDGTTWIASEGNGSDSRPNRLVQLDDGGTVTAEIGLPDEVLACRAASTNRGSLGSGFEGVAVEPDADGAGGYVVHVAQQRGWDYTTPECAHLDDDPDDVDPGEPAWTRVWTYDPATETWDHIPYELEAVPEDAAWVGLSEITALDDRTFAFIERDNRTGDGAELKWLTAAALADGEVTRSSKAAYDLLPDMRASNGWISDKVEGLAVTRHGRVYVVTDNDGVDEWSGETQLLRLGRARNLFDELPTLPRRHQSVLLQATLPDDR